MPFADQGSFELAAFWPGFPWTPLPAPGLRGLRGAVNGQKVAGPRACAGRADLERSGEQARHRWTLRAGWHPQ